MIAHPTRLYWENGHGFAKLRGVARPLTSPPVLWGNPVHMIDYVPMGESKVARVQERSVDPPRDLRPDEEEKVIFFLAKMCNG